MRMARFAILLLSVVLVAGSGRNTVSGIENSKVKLSSLRPEDVLSKLDPDNPKLESVKAASRQGDRIRALHELLIYYRDTRRYRMKR